MWPSSATAAAARPRCTRRCCSRRRSPRASAASSTAPSLSDAERRRAGARDVDLGAALNSFEWQDRKINLLDTPGEPSFVADALGALRVCESAVFVVNAVMGVEVSTVRLWERATELDLARLVFVNMLDRERADFFRTLESLKAAFGPHVVATEIPIGTEHDVRGVIDLVDMKAYEYDDVSTRATAARSRSPTTCSPRRRSTARS